MLMGVLRPAAIGAVVLNDIGPVIEREGLARIVAYIGRVPLPATWKEATELVTEMNRRQFPAVTAQQWAEFARQVFNDDNGLPAPSYDPNLSKAISLLSGESARPVAAVRRAQPCADAGHARRELRHPERQDLGRDASCAIRASMP